MVKTDPRPTLVYCRESRDENSANYQRIEVQRDILLAFCERQGLRNIVDVILDDDCTGTDFGRFDEIIRRVKNKEIQVIVFKDASRLGRNLKESLIFRDLMEDQGAEILFESEAYDEDFFPLKAWFNEQRAKDDSKKIRRTMRHKMETGTLLVKPVYGYRRAGPGHMVPQEETAQVVRWLFGQAADGRSSGELAAALNAGKVPTPSQAAHMAKAARCWNAQHIRRILTNPAYIGTQVYHRTSKKSFKSKKTLRHPEEEWIVHEDHHQGLVSRELFEKVQSTRRRFKRETYTRKERPFSGLLYCGRCGSRLVLRTKQGRPDAYICGRNHREGALRDELGCRPHHVREDFLRDVVLAYMKKLLESVPVDMDTVSRELERPCHERQEDLLRKLEALRRDMDAVYEDKLRGVIPESLFLRKFQELSQRERALQDQIRQWEEKIEKKPPEEQLTDFRMGDIINRLDAKKLTKQQLRLMFEAILVYEPEEIREEDRARLGLTQTQYEQLRARGGIVFRENAMPP